MEVGRSSSHLTPQIMQAKPLALDTHNERLWAVLKELDAGHGYAGLKAVSGVDEAGVGVIGEPTDEGVSRAEAVDVPDVEALVHADTLQADGKLA